MLFYFDFVVVVFILVVSIYAIKSIFKSVKYRLNPIKNYQFRWLDKLFAKTKNSKPVNLSLLVPASLVRNVEKDKNIEVSDIEELIDNSLYFLCTNPGEIKTIEQSLELSKEDITAVSDEREVYIRIQIDDKKEMLSQRVPYILKRNLPPNGKGIVEKLDCLKYLSTSGLEKFNRL